MSKRYGRNRKRRDKAEIARWQEAYTASNALARHASSKLSEANSILNRVARIIRNVCGNSVALPPQTVRGSRDLDRWGIRPVSLVNCEAVTFKDIDLYALEVMVERNREAMNTVVHLNYAVGKRVRYMISEAALQSIPTEVLMEQILPSVLTQMVGSLKSDLGRRL